MALSKFIETTPIIQKITGKIEYDQRHFTNV